MKLPPYYGGMHEKQTKQTKYQNLEWIHEAA